jgi:hypothetical protein
MYVISGITLDVKKEEALKGGERVTFLYTILISDQYAGLILAITRHGYILKNRGALREGNSRELKVNRDVESDSLGLQVSAQTFRSIVGDSTLDLHLFRHNSPKNKNERK